MSVAWNKDRLRNCSRQRVTKLKTWEMNAIWIWIFFCNKGLFGGNWKNLYFKVYSLGSVLRGDPPPSQFSWLSQGPLEKNLTPRSCNPSGGPTLYLWEIHAPTQKHKGNQASKKVLPPSSTVGLSGRRPQLREYLSPLCTSSCITQPEVVPTSSREVAEYTSIPNQPLRHCSMTVSLVHL